MRFSSPSTRSRLRKPMSASTSATLCPSFANAPPRFAVVVVFPTPPLPEVTTYTIPAKRYSLWASAARPTTLSRASLGHYIIIPRFVRALRLLYSPMRGLGRDPAISQPRDFRLRSLLAPLFVRRDRKLCADALLHRFEAQREDLCRFVAFRPGMRHAA